MTVLTTSLDRRSEAFAANAAAMRTLVHNLRERVTAIREGGGETARRRHLARGKLLPRERVRALLDPGSPFLELSQLAANAMYGGEVPAAGIITGMRSCTSLRSLFARDVMIAKVSTGSPPSGVHFSDNPANANNAPPRGVIRYGCLLVPFVSHS